jgi:hypothetical protein
VEELQTGRFKQSLSCWRHAVTSVGGLVHRLSRVVHTSICRCNNGEQLHDPEQHLVFFTVHSPSSRIHDRRSNGLPLRQVLRLLLQSSRLARQSLMVHCSRLRCVFAWAASADTRAHTAHRKRLYGFEPPGQPCNNQLQHQQQLGTYWLLFNCGMVVNAPSALHGVSGWLRLCWFRGEVKPTSQGLYIQLAVVTAACQGTDASTATAMKYSRGLHARFPGAYSCLRT